MVVYKRNFSPVWPWGSTGSRFREACTCHQHSSDHSSWLSFPPFSSPHNFHPAARSETLSSQHTITSVFPPSSNRSHLQTQQHMPVSGSASAALSPLGLESVRSAAWHHWLLLRSVSKCRITTRSPYSSLKQMDVMRAWHVLCTLFLFGNSDLTKGIFMTLKLA